MSDATPPSADEHEHTDDDAKRLWFGLTPWQLVAILSIIIVIIIALSITGLFTWLVKMFVMLFIELMTRIAKLIFRW